jgi:hypothetical protein
MMFRLLEGSYPCRLGRSTGTCKVHFFHVVVYHTIFSCLIKKLCSFREVRRCRAFRTQRAGKTDHYPYNYGTETGQLPIQLRHGNRTITYTIMARKQDNYILTIQLGTKEGQ